MTKNDQFLKRSLRWFLQLGVGFFLCATGWADKKPNFLVILTDDHGVGDVSAYRKGDLGTPSIDQIGKEGILFTQMRANCTVCSPSRAAFLTGRYADRVGVPGVIRTRAEDSWGFFDPTTPTLGDELRKAGYGTALIGKWHLGLTSPNLPNERGFDFFHGFLGDMMDDYYSHQRHGQNYMRRNEEVISAEGHATEVFTDWAIDYLKEWEKDEPFFLFLSYNAPHFPIQPPKEWIEKVRSRGGNVSEGRVRNIAFVEHLDHEIGRVMAALDEVGLRDDTVVVFASDNGGSLPHFQNNDPWRGGKQDHFEGGIRIPMMIRWPAVVEAGRVAEYPGLLFDLFPTFLELAGLASPADLDAVSLCPLLRGEEMERERELYFVRREGNMKHRGQSYQALIQGEWKLLQNHPFEFHQLYHLGRDLYEKEDVSNKNPKVYQEMMERLRWHTQRGGVTPWFRDHK